MNVRSGDVRRLRGDHSRRPRHVARHLRRTRGRHDRPDRRQLVHRRLDAARGSRDGRSRRRARGGTVRGWESDGSPTNARRRPRRLLPTRSSRARRPTSSGCTSTRTTRARIGPNPRAADGGDRIPGGRAGPVVRLRVQRRPAAPSTRGLASSRPTRRSRNRRRKFYPEAVYTLEL